nr:hypothetical protein [uncultured Roseovarius sp.]
MIDRTPKGIDLADIIDAFKRHGGQIRAVARELDCHHSNVSRRLTQAVLAGDERIDPALLFKDRKPQSLPMQEIMKAREELGMRNERKRAKGDWRKPSLINLEGGPILLGIFGDPHLDNSGTDLELFEEELSRRDPSRRIFTACGGDFFDNWPRAMGHLYQESGDPSPAWTLFEYWMEQWPFLFSVSGNHDQFASGTANFLDVFMRERGSLLRRSGGRFILNLGEGQPVSIAMRHIWQGNSQYSEAHNLKRAVTFGHTDDDLVCGFHFHKGELRTHIRPSDGKVSKLAQISSFKRMDNYANDRGFMSPETPPVVWCVIDAREPVTSHARVQPFYEFSEALAMLAHRRGKNC